MYSVSQNFKNAIMSTSRILKAKVLINSREYDESYIVEMNYEDTSNPSGSFEIGTVASAILNLSVVGVNEAFETATIKPYIGLDLNGTVEYVPLGVFYCDRVERKKDVVTLTCYDGMIKLEKAYFSDLTYPATITAVMNEICTKAGIQFTGTLPNYSFSKKPEGYKFREVVAFIAQMCGGFAKFDRDGKLRIKSYTTTSETITADHYMDDGFSKKKDAVFRIDKITCQVGENTISKGTLSAGGSEVQFENPFMTDAIMTDLYNKLKGFQYLPVYLQFVGNPAYDVGDIVTLVTVDDETIQIPIMVNKLAFSGGLTGEIESVGETENSNQFDSSGSLTNKVERVVYELAFINEALINKATIEDLEATNARIDNLITNDLTAINAAIENLQADKANITDLEAVNAAIENLQATKANIEDLNATNAKIDNLQATKANITDLDAVNAAIQNLQADKADITDLNATNARIDNLVTNDLTAINAAIANLQAGKANITDLNATNARVGALEADVGSINTLLAGNLGAENFRAGAIYAGSGVIAQGAIGDAEISNLNASKINAGILNTALVTIQGVNGRLKMSGNRLQVFANKTDGTLYERVSLGDVNGDGSIYGLRVRGADGQTVLLDENGVKREGITDGSITNEKIADDANISGTKLDIASVVTQINNGTTTIQSSKIFYDGKTLDVQFSSMKNTVNAQGQTITNHETRITATEQGLATKVSVSQYQQDQAALSSQLSQMSTQIQQQANQIALKADASSVYTKSQIDGQFTAVNTQISNLSAQLTLQADQIATKVSRTEFESLQIGGRNLFPNSKEFTTGGYGVISEQIDGFNVRYLDNLNKDTTAEIFNYSFEYERNSEYVISFWVKGSGTGIFIISDYSKPVETVSSLGEVGVDDGGRLTFALPNNWVRVWIRIKTANWSVEKAKKPTRIWAGAFSDIYLYGIKFEKGNRATDWTPAPEDFQGQIDGLGSRMTTAETSITQLSNQIALKANQTTVDTLANRISSAESTINLLSDEIQLKVDKDGVISAINQTAESIKIQASKVDLSGYVTFTNLSTPGQTTIDGGNLKTGSITADKLNVTSLSAISGNLGTVNAGTINGININGSIINGSEFHATGSNGVVNIYGDTIESRNNAVPDLVKIAKMRQGLITIQRSTSSSFERSTLDINSLGFELTSLNDTISLNIQANWNSKAIEIISPGGLIVSSGLISADTISVGAISFSKRLISNGTIFLVENRYLADGGGLNARNSDIINVNALYFNDPGVNEGIIWSGGNEWKIFEAPDNLSNAAGNLQFVTGSTRRVTFTTAGNIISLGSLAQLENNGVFSSNTGYVVLRSVANQIVYLQGSEVRATKPSLPDQYIPVRASSFPTASLAENKLDIHVWEGSALELIRNATIYEYRTKWEAEQGIYRWRQGLVVGEGYNTPAGVIDGDGVEQYLMNAWSWKAIQELDVDLSATIDRIAWLETENSYLKQRVNYLENKLNELEAQIA